MSDTDKINELELKVGKLESKVEELLSLTANLDEIEKIAKEAMYRHDDVVA